MKYILVILFLLFLHKNSAQLCTGSFGDPSVNINFGNGPNPGNPINKTTYSYVNNSCPNDGQYTIANSSFNCFADTWHSIPQDHTPNDANGYFMIVNASLAPGAFYLDTVEGLCENTQYEFAAWIMNVIKPSSCNSNSTQPNVTFSIETTNGVVITSLNTNNIPPTNSPAWQQYGVFFTALPGVNRVVLRLTNNAPGGCGNDLALDDISFRPCGPQISSFIVQTNSTEAEICEGANAIFNFSSSLSAGYTNPAFQWQLSIDNGLNWSFIDGANTLNYLRQPTVSGNFWYRIIAAENVNFNNSSCRVASTPLKITVNRNPLPDITSNSPVCKENLLLITAHDGATFEWKGPNGFISNNASLQFANADINLSGKYDVKVISAKNCVGYDTIDVFVYPIPTAEAGRDSFICKGNSIELSASGGGSYLWSPATHLSSISIADPIATPDTTTVYYVTVKNNFNCSDIDSVKIIVYKIPVANAGPDLKIFEGDTITLKASVDGDLISYYWLPQEFINSPSLIQPKVFPPFDKTYTLHVLSNVGCNEAIDAAFIRVFNKIYIPNAFSPNGDGVNDVWNIFALYTYPEAVVQVHNRYGSLVFSSRGYTKPWDGKYQGKSLPMGAYFYVIDLKNDLPVLKGSLNIIR